MRQPVRRSQQDDPPGGGAELAATPRALPGPRSALLAVAAADPPPTWHAAKRIWARPWIPATAASVMGIALAVGYALNMSDQADTSDSRSLPGVVACAETIAAGKVTSVRRQDDRYAVTLDAARFLKPDHGPAILSVSDARLPTGGSSAEPAVGEQALVVVHDAAKGSVDLFTGTDVGSEWAWMEKALPDSRSIDPKECDKGD